MQRNTVSFPDNGYVERQNARQFFDRCFRILLSELRERARGAPPSPSFLLFFLLAKCFGWPCRVPSLRTLREERKGERRDNSCCHRALAFVGISTSFIDNILGIWRRRRGYLFLLLIAVGCDSNNKNRVDAFRAQYVRKNKKYRIERVCLIFRSGHPNSRNPSPKPGVRSWCGSVNLYWERQCNYIFSEKQKKKKNR